MIDTLDVWLGCSSPSSISLLTIWEICLQLTYRYTPYTEANTSSTRNIPVKDSQIAVDALYLSLSCLMGRKNGGVGAGVTVTSIVDVGMPLGIVSVLSGGIVVSVTMLSSVVILSAMFVVVVYTSSVVGSSIVESVDER